MRFSGTVGFATSTQTSPGVWEDVITEKPFFGDVIRNSRRRYANNNIPILNLFLQLIHCGEYCLFPR